MSKNRNITANNNISNIITDHEVIGIKINITGNDNTEKKN